MATLHVLRVFTGPDGSGGNPLGVFLNGGEVPADRRQEVAADLGFSETVFVDDVTTGVVQIFTPAAELPFAGHPLVGTSWLLDANGLATDTLRPPVGEVPTGVDADGTVWIRGRAAWAPEMSIQMFDSPAAVDALAGPPEGADFLDAWAWIDEAAGTVRCRVFAPVYGIAEDEATGAAAARLVTQLGRPIEIHQGLGSRIVAAPAEGGSAKIAGSCVLEEVRPYRFEE